MTLMTHVPRHQPPTSPKQARARTTPSHERIAGRVLVGPGVHALVRSPSSGVPAARTRLGKLAERLVDQTLVTTLSVAAVSGYVYALCNTGAPTVTFTTLPPGMGPSQLEPLQAAYNTFQSQFSAFQGSASLWVQTQSSGVPSIVAQLVAVPRSISTIDAIVRGYFDQLASLPPASSAYQQTLSKIETLIGSEELPITSLVASMTSLGTTLATSSSSLVESTKAGVLAQMLAAYAEDLGTLQDDVAAAQSQITKDNAKIIGDGVGATASFVTGLVGLANFWNPIGWITIAAGAIGAYFSIADIALLKAQVASLNGQIQKDMDFQSTDQAAASVLAMFSAQLTGFTSMSSSAQKELLTLESLYRTLGAEITEALTELGSGDLDAARSEWVTIVEGAKPLAELTSYLWPSPTQLSSPSPMAVVGGDLYYVATSGKMFHYASATGAWTDLGAMALSCVGGGATIVAIDGAPIDGSSVGPTTAPSTYHVKQLDPSSGSWTPISTFPACCVAVDGSASAGPRIYAVGQITSDRQVYAYGGVGTTWSALPAVPGPDAVNQIAVAGGVLFALTNNSQLVYRYDASSVSWTPIVDFACTSIVGNGDELAIIDSLLNPYLYRATSGDPPVQTGAGVMQIAQLTNGNQYRIGPDLSLWLYEASDSPAWTQIASDVTSIFAGDTDSVVYVDKRGDLYALSASGESTRLPKLP